MARGRTIIASPASLSRLRFVAWLFAWPVLAPLTGCDRAPAQPPIAPPSLSSDELVVLVRPGPATFYAGPDGEPAGFDADLARLFAAREQMGLRFVPLANPSELFDAIAHHKAHIGAGGLYRPNTPGVRATLFPGAGRAEPPDVLWSAGYHKVEPVLVYNIDGFKPQSWRDLIGERVAYVAGTGLDEELQRLRSEHPDVEWIASDAPSGDALLAQVSDGRLDYAIVASNVAALSRNVYLAFEVAFAVDGRRELGWIVAPEAEELRARIDNFFAQIKRDGTLARLVDRHFGHAGEVPRIDAGILQDRIRSVLPQFRRAFQLAQQTTGIEWRLLAAIAYQESQWDPQAASPTGARGIMQLTGDTARHLGVIDRLDPKLSIEAAARYLQTLKDKLPDRIQEPDRTWLALAAFNIGLGHLEDARVLAQRQKLNPDLWSDVKKTLPLLAQPEHYENARLGYARGGMPVAFVDRVRAYYDVLLAHQPGFQPRLKVPEPTERDTPVLALH